ncbi:DUF5979 domain-containing protein [Bifidobacterium crudilactis]|jgi:hypothetical protein|uniref:DUF5979 domain-containing protein n=1 Tax=Bifidobacterium crudilactis TaxID=327277 RepID=UPI00235277F4|nr:DUF5979 domain-containing protein [Bifidobacterium crudilactis]MCI1218266.1 DUF5979 domain-containing protein [Bifidobacterium crudilactis]
MSDALPQGLKGFAIKNIAMDQAGFGPVVTWSEGGSTLSAAPDEIGDSTVLSVALNQSFSGGAGLAAGVTFHINLSLQVPPNFAPDDSRNGQTITNTAQSKADNSADDSSSASIKVSVKQQLAAAITKTWDPGTASFAPGAPSTIGLTATNTSNVTVDTMTVQDPVPDSSPDGATALPESNPFNQVDFKGFGDTNLPNGATGVQVDAYVYRDGSWKWVKGTPSTTYALPSGVEASAVGGMRFTYTGVMAPKASSAVKLNVVQRSTDRNTAADLSNGEHDANNVAQAQTAKGAQTSDPVTDKATYKVTPVNLGVSTVKDFSKDRLSAGDDFNATITSTNTNSPVNKLTISDTNAADSPFFDANTTFNGFIEGVQYPEGATSGTVIYHMLDGGADQTVHFASGAVPANPNGKISGFDVTFTAGGDDIATGATTTLKFDVASTAASIPSGKDEATLKNVASSVVTTQNGRSTNSKDDAELALLKPNITAKLKKTITPGNKIGPGHAAVVALESTATATTDYVKTNKIVVEDAWGTGKPEDGFWNAFDLTSIQPTQVPANASLNVEVQNANGNWVSLDSYAAQAATSIYKLSAGDLSAKLSAAGLSTESVVGIRFTFSSASGTTFPVTTTVKPYVSFTAREKLRSDGKSATDNTDGENAKDQVQTEYNNHATTDASAKVKDQTISGEDDGDAKTGIIVYPGDDGTGPAAKVSKAWSPNNKSVSAQTDASATANLNWRVNKGLSKVVLSDPADNADSPKSTVFDAFNLTGIASINISDTPYANGWFLKYDTITSIELYQSGAWHEVAAPDGSWQDGKGNFKGYTLSKDEQGTLLDASGATGVRITVEPNDAARQKAIDQGTDPYVPAVGTGVAESSSDRTFSLNWQLRKKTRSSGDFITSKSRLNVPESEAGVDDNKGVVNNTLLVEGTYGDKTSKDQGNDTIAILDQPMAVGVSKTTDAGNKALVVPVKSTVKDEDYPKATYTLTSANTSSAPASYLRVTDPSLCSDTKVDACATENTAEKAKANPFTGLDASKFDTDNANPNPFNRLNITKITIAAPSEQVDLTKSVVWMLKYTVDGNGDGQYKVVESTADKVNAMSEEALVDVVGISVTYQGTDPASTGGTITPGDQRNGTNVQTVQIATQVRSKIRSTGEAYEPSTDKAETSTNRVFAQSYDPIIYSASGSGTDADKATDAASAELMFQGGKLDVQPAKTITPGDDIVETDRGAQRDVTLNATPGSSTVSPSKVTLTDQPDKSGDANGDADASTDFWKNFNLQALKSITFPTGATQVQISVYGPFGDNGAQAWKSGAAQAKNTGASAYTLPVSADQYPNIQGLRFVFTNPDPDPAENGKLNVFSTTDANWHNAGAVFTVELNDAAQKAEPFSGTATNRLTVQSESGSLKSEKKSDDRTVKWGPGTAVLGINKLTNNGNRLASAGTMVPWDITISNDGTGYLDLVDVEDTLPDALVYTGMGQTASVSPWTFTAGTLPNGSDGSLKTVPTMVYTPPKNDLQQPAKLHFSWPKDESRLQPGEKIVIRIWLELQPGPKSGEQVKNVVDVKTIQELTAVKNAIPGDRDDTVQKNGDHSGSASDYVSPTSGENLVVNKGVIGSQPGAVNSLDQSQDCTPTLKGADGKSYYRFPCVANSAVNGTDSWILHMINAGTTNITSAQFFDQLPVSGDKALVASGMDRGSTFRPRLTGDLKVVGAPEGTTETIEVTNDANACVGTWSTLPAAANACGSNTWTKADGSTDWAAVTGIRVTLDFTTSASGFLAPAQTADLTYSTKNEARTSEDASGASTNVPAVNEYAWNQFGLLFRGESGARRLAPEKVGVNLRTGSLSVVKKVSGDAVSYAPDSFEATVSCSIPASGASKKVSLTFGAKQEQQLTVTMNKLPDGSYAAQRVSGIPLGAICHIAENGDTGTYGETTRKNAETDVNIVKADSYSSSTDQSGDPTNDVPAAQVATIDNEYEYSSLSVTKKVDTVADKGKFGPFDFTLSCTTSDNRTVKFGDSDSVAFSLAAGATWNAPENTIPANAKCALRETDADGAVSTVFTGDGVTQSAADAATIVVGSEKSKVVSSLVTNHYDGGTLTVTKKVAGEGAARYGSGKFTFHADCTYSGKSGEQRLLDQEFTLSAGESKVFGVFPSGTQCTVKETKSAGASSSSMNPEGGVVTIAKQTEQGVPSNVEVEATNTYDVGNVTIIKKRTGAGAEIRGKGPFEAQIVCTYLSDGTQVTADLPNNGKVELSAANGYTATVNGILLGAQCQITETKDGGADSTSMDPHDGKLTIAQDTSKNVVTITNVFKAKAPITPAANTPAKSLSKTGAAVATVVVAAVFCFAVGAGIMMVSRARRRGEPEDSGAHKA